MIKRTSINTIRLTFNGASQQLCGNSPSRKCLIFGPANAQGAYSFSWQAMSTITDGVVIVAAATPFVLSREELGNSLDLAIYVFGANGEKITVIEVIEEPCMTEIDVVISGG